MLKLIYQFTEKIRDKVSKLNEKGQGMVEYAIILAVVAAVGVAVFYGTSSGGDAENNGLSNTNAADTGTGLKGAVQGAFTKATDEIEKVGK